MEPIEISSTETDDEEAKDLGTGLKNFTLNKNLDFLNF